MPTLHVYGTNDAIIDPARCEALADCFVAPERYKARHPFAAMGALAWPPTPTCARASPRPQHEGGHFIPTQAAARSRYAAFLQRFMPQADAPDAAAT